MGKEFTCSAGDTGDVGSIPGSGISPGGGDGNPLQYSSLQHSTDREAWRATVQRAAKSQTPQGDEAHTHGKTDNQLCSENHCGKNAWGAKMSTAKTLQESFWTHFKPGLENTKNRKR